MNKELIITAIASSIVIVIFAGSIISLNLHNLQIATPSQTVGSPSSPQSDSYGSAGVSPGSSSNQTNKVRWTYFETDKQDYSWDSSDQIPVVVYVTFRSTEEGKLETFLMGPVDDHDPRHHKVDSTKPMCTESVRKSVFHEVANFAISCPLSKNDLPYDGEYILQGLVGGVKSNQTIFFVDGRK